MQCGETFLHSHSRPAIGFATPLFHGVLHCCKHAARVPIFQFYRILFSSFCLPRFPQSDFRGCQLLLYFPHPSYNTAKVCLRSRARLPGGAFLTVNLASASQLRTRHVVFVAPLRSEWPWGAQTLHTPTKNDSLSFPGVPFLTPPPGKSDSQIPSPHPNPPIHTQKTKSGETGGSPSF